MGFLYSIKEPLAGTLEGAQHPYFIDYVMTAQPDEAELAAHRSAPSPFHLVFFLGAPKEDTSWIKEEAEDASTHLLQELTFRAGRAVARSNVSLELLSHLDPATSGVRIAFKTEEDRQAFTRFQVQMYLKQDGFGPANHDVFHAPRALNNGHIPLLYTDNIPEGSYPSAPHRAFGQLLQASTYKHPHWWQTNAKNDAAPQRPKAPVVATILQR